jgi:transcriptional regulator with XRE-family HTH domain
MKNMKDKAGADSEDIGYLLQRQRAKKNISIRELAKKAGVSPAIISRIEQGHSSPSFTTFQKILNPLGLNFATFFSKESHDGGSPVIRKQDMKKTCLGDKCEVLMLDADKDKNIQMFIETYSPGGSTGTDMLSHDSVETAVCIRGKLKLELAGKTYLLSEGDGFVFDSKLPHRISNPTSKTSILVSANTPAVF